MDLYIGNVEKWQEFFNGLNCKQNQEATKLSFLLNSIRSKDYNLKDVEDCFKSNYVGNFSFDTLKRIGVFNSESEMILSDRNADDGSYNVFELIYDNQDYEEDFMEDESYIDVYVRFFTYNGIHNGIRIFKNIAQIWSENYIDVVDEILVIVNVDNATHGIYFVPYGNVVEVWLYESSANFYRFRCFAEMIVVNAIAGYLGYDKLEKVTLDDLKKYNADLILNLDLLQKSDLPMG